ncbi:MAG: 4-hydroxy-3-methylbut-2-enyl diphosphate reductase [Candidatus Sumerlaeaceae bacterium]|nr:4-hydroxy-3-methylbut-2-enyl diphosphate reductase [Candidatus Sumerlaeaceae bacterium]
MKVIRAQALGMCFGVKDALNTIRSLESPGEVTVYGELVHNPRVLAEIESRGISQVGECERGPVPETSSVLITAHGLSNLERQRLVDAGKQIIDTTCPLVRRVHAVACMLDRAGYFVIVIGRRDHVEVQGIIGDLNSCVVISSLPEVRFIGKPRIGIVAQTTTPPAEADRIASAIRDANPGSEIRWVNTVCRPTRERQEAATVLLGQVEMLVVVGGRHSNNTRQLVALAQSKGLPVQHVEHAGELDREALRTFRVVGLTAGTSTLDETIRDVEAALEAIPTLTD